MDERFNQQELEYNLLRDDLAVKKLELEDAEENRQILEAELSRLREHHESASEHAQESKHEASMNRIQTLEELAFIPQNLAPVFQRHAKTDPSARSPTIEPASPIEIGQLKARISQLERQLMEAARSHELAVDELETELSGAKREQELAWEQHEQARALDTEALACLERENDLLRAEAARLTKRLGESLDKQERSSAELQAELVLLMKERDAAHRRAEAERRGAAAHTRAWADSVAERVMEERLAFEQERGLSTFQRERFALALQRIQAAISALPNEDSRPPLRRPAAATAGAEPAAERLEERLELLEMQLASERLQNEKLKQVIVRDRTRPFLFEDEQPGSTGGGVGAGGGGGSRDSGDGGGDEVARLREQLRAASQHIQSLTMPGSGRPSGASGGGGALPRGATGKGGAVVRSHDTFPPFPLFIADGRQVLMGGSWTWREYARGSRRSYRLSGPLRRGCGRSWSEPQTPSRRSGGGQTRRDPPLMAPTVCSCMQYH